MRSRATVFVRWSGGSRREPRRVRPPFLLGAAHARLTEPHRDHQLPRPGHVRTRNRLARRRAPPPERHGSGTAGLVATFVVGLLFALPSPVGGIPMPSKLLWHVLPAFRVPSRWDPLLMTALLPLAALGLQSGAGALQRGVAAPASCVMRRSFVLRAGDASRRSFPHSSRSRLSTRRSSGTPRTGSSPSTRWATRTSIASGNACTAGRS